MIKASKIWNSSSYKLDHSWVQNFWNIYLGEHEIVFETEMSPLIYNCFFWLIFHHSSNTTQQQLIRRQEDKSLTGQRHLFDNITIIFITSQNCLNFND